MGKKQKTKRILNEIMKDFANASLPKEELITRLTEELDLHQNEAYAIQVSRMLGRELLPNEVFTLDALFRVSKFKNQTNGGRNRSDRTFFLPFVDEDEV